jgi:5-methylcytosine-specific restriction protein A
VSANYDLVPNAIYRRTELHTRFGRQRQDGISTPASSPVVLVFSGSTGTRHGYSDGSSNGVFCDFGEGQKGDLLWLRGNAAIRDHGKNGRDLLLFEMLSEPRSHVRFLGNYACGSRELRNAPAAVPPLQLR